MSGAVERSANLSPGKDLETGAGENVSLRQNDDFGSPPHRIQRQRTKGWRMPENTVSVTRPGPWGNYAGSTRAAFEQDLATMSNADRAFYFEKLKALRGKNLACWCRLGQPCHADVLLELANA